MEIDLSDYYYKQKFQGERVKRSKVDESIFEIHASHLSHCITKACYYLYCNENNIKIPFDQKSINNMEWGNALHMLHQKLDRFLSELKDDQFGWYPWFDKRFDRSVVDDWNFIEILNTEMYRNIIQVFGTYDQEMMDSKGIFIQEIKSTGGYKWIDKPRKNHIVQVHVYLWLRERNVNTIDIWAELQEQWKDVAYKPVRRVKIKYVDRYNPLKVKIFDVKFNIKHYDFIHEQLDKYYAFTNNLYLHNTFKLGDMIFPEPNYDYLADWECNPKYCPFSVKEGCPLNEPCKNSRWLEQD